MADPTTVNIALAVPTRGSDVGTWDLPINGDMSSLDGHLGGVQAISLSNVNVTLTSPSGSITPSGGPTQAENAVIRLTGTLTGNVQITLPLPGPIIIENITTGNFVVSFRAVGSGEIIATPQGSRKTIYNDGTNVRFVSGADPGVQELWAGLIAMPSWVAACTSRPYLLCDGSVYNFSDYPFLGARLVGTFGGNGITTFGVPDLRGRVPLPYDGTGTRITTAGCGIDGQTLGASADNQSITLNTTQIPAHSHGVTDPGHTHTSDAQKTIVGIGTITGGNNVVNQVAATINSATTGITINNTGGGLAHANVQPSIVTGIWVIKT